MSYSLESSQDLPGAEESSPPPTYNRPTQLSISKGLIISNNVHDQYSPILSPSPVPSDTHLPSCDEVHLADSSEDSDESESGEESGHEAEEIVNVNHVNVVGREAEQARAPISTSSESESQPIPVVVPPTAGGVGSDEVSAEDRPSHVSLLGGKYLLFANPNPNPAAPTQPAPACPVLSSNKNIQKCINVETREHFFCKVVPRSAAGLSLLATYHRLDDFSDCINKIHEIILGPKQIYLIFPLNYGNVHSYLLAKKRLREGEAAHLFRQMVKAVQFCHDKGIVLRDLKLGKFVFLDKERTIIKLESLEDAVLLSENSDDGLSDKHGCPNYVSPEKAEILRSNNKYPGKATDIWGLGVMLYTMLVGRYPFNDPDHSKLFNKIRRGAFTIPEQLSTNSKCLIRCLLRKEPTGRLSCPEIIMHPWLMDQRRGGTTLASAVEATREGMNRGFTGRGARPQILNQQQPLRAAGKPMDTDDQVVPVYNPPTSS